MPPSDHHPGGIHQEPTVSGSLRGQPRVVGLDPLLPDPDPAADHHKGILQGRSLDRVDRPKVEPLPQGHRGLEQEGVRGRKDEPVDGPTGDRHEKAEKSDKGKADLWAGPDGVDELPLSFLRCKRKEALAGLARFELATYGLGGRRSIL